MSPRESPHHVSSTLKPEPKISASQTSMREMKNNSELKTEVLQEARQLLNEGAKLLKEGKAAEAVHRLERARELDLTQTLRMDTDFTYEVSVGPLTGPRGQNMGMIVVCRDDDAEADVLEIRPGEAGRHRDGLHALFPLHLKGGFHEPLHRVAPRELGLERRHHRGLPERLRRPQAPVEDPGHDVDGLEPPLVAVDVGVGVVSDEDVGAIHHQPRVVCVEVEGGDDGPVPDELPHL